MKTFRAEPDVIKMLAYGVCLARSPLKQFDEATDDELSFPVDRPQRVVDGKRRPVGKADRGCVDGCRDHGRAVVERDEDLSGEHRANLNDAGVEERTLETSHAVAGIEKRHIVQVGGDAHRDEQPVLVLV